MSVQLAILEVTTACANITSVAIYHRPSVAQHVRLEAVADTACRLVQGDFIELRGRVGDPVDQTKCCQVHVQRCQGNLGEFWRLINQLEAEAEK